MLAEIIGGALANSLAIMTDAAHLFSDCSGFFISICALKIGKRRPTKKFTYGYLRAEVLGALGSVLIIWFLTVFLVVEAVDRIIHPTEVDGVIMLVTASIGLLCNIVMGKILHSPSMPGSHHHHHGHSHGCPGHGHHHHVGEGHEHLHEHHEHHHHKSPSRNEGQTSHTTEDDIGFSNDVSSPNSAGGSTEVTITEQISSPASRS